MDDWTLFDQQYLQYKVLFGRYELLSTTSEGHIDILNSSSNIRLAPAYEIYVPQSV